MPLSPMKVVYMLKLVLVNFLASRGDPKLKKNVEQQEVRLASGSRLPSGCAT